MGFAATVAVGIVGALLGWVLFTYLLGIGDSDKFDLGGVIGAIVGTMQLTFILGISFRGAWRMQIEAVRIASAVRGQGLGAEMIAWAVEEARGRGCRTVQLTSMSTRTDAHRFYERLGFVKSHVGMKLQLTEQAT